MNRCTVVAALVLLLVSTGLALGACHKDDTAEDSAPQPTLSIDTQSLPDGVVGSIYTEMVSASGGVGALSWDLAAGPLAPGLSLSPSGTPHALISGTPTFVGTSQFVLRVRDSAMNEATRAMQITVTASGSMRFETPLLPAAQVGVQYYGPLSITGGTGTINTMIVSAGTLPPGMFLDFTGTPPPAVRGTPTQAGTFQFTLLATDTSINSASRAYTITVLPVGAPLQIVFALFPGGERGQPYFGMASAAGGVAPLSWTKSGGYLGASLTFNGGSYTTFATVTGTPSSAGTFTFQIEAQDSLGASQSATIVLRIDGPLEVQSATLPSAVINQSYSRQVFGQGGTQSGYVWTLAGGTLPPGISVGPGFYGDDGLVSGTPTALGNFAFTLRLEDSAGVTALGNFSILVATTANPLLFVTTALPDAVAGRAYNATVTASGGTGGFNWLLLSGSLPLGLNLAPSGTPSTTLSGTCATPGSYSFTLQVSDSTQTASQYFDLLVRPAFDITTTSLPDGRAGQAYSQAITASGGSGLGFVWDISQGALPVGLTLGATGTPTTTLSGTPGATGFFNFTVRVTDSASNMDTQAFTLLVTQSGTISTVMGQGGSQPTADGLTALASNLWNPTSIRFVSGDMWVCERGNHRIRKVDASTGQVTTMAGNSNQGFAGDGGLAVNAQFNFPNDFVFDGAGNMFIADTGNHRIRRVDSGGNISTYAGTGIAGSTGDAGQASLARLDSPHSLLILAGNLYVTCRGDNRVRVINLSSNVINLFAGSGSTLGDGGPATLAQLSAPTGIAADVAGNIYVAEYNGQRVRRIDVSLNISTFAGGGASTADGVPATTASLYRPEGLRFDAAGNLYIADSWHNVVRAVDATSGNIFTVAGTGVQGFSGDGGPATLAQLWIPVAVAFDGTGNCYIADTSNNRIRRVTP